MELQSPQLRLRPRKVGVAPPTVGLSNEGWPANRAMEPSNQKASGEEKNRSGLARAERRVRQSSWPFCVWSGAVTWSANVVCGPLRWLLVVVVVEQSAS